jgi:hypothetical protein
MLIDPLRALSNLRSREALNIPIPEHLDRALRGDVPPAKSSCSPQKAAGGRLARNGALEASKAPPGKHSAPEPAGEPPAKHSRTTEGGSPEHQTDNGLAHEEVGGVRDAAPLDSADVVDQAALEPLRPSLAVGSWCSTSKRSPQKVLSGASRGMHAAGDGPTTHTWGWEPASDAGEMEPLPTECTAASVRRFVGALRQRLPEMAHRAVPRACTQFESLCNALLKDLKGQGREDVLAQVRAGLQVLLFLVLACRCLCVLDGGWMCIYDAPSDAKEHACSWRRGMMGAGAMSGFMGSQGEVSAASCRG